MFRCKLKELLLIFASFHVTRPSPPSRLLTIPFLEEQSVGAEVHNLKEDSPAEKRDEISFKIIRQFMTVGEETVNDETKWVTLNEESGVISVANPVDRERDCVGERDQSCVIRLKVIRNPQRFFELIDINLNVIDVNDHSPVFPVGPTIFLNISESTPVTTRINMDRYLATDADAGANANVYYTLSRSDYFSIYQTKDDVGAIHLSLVITDDLDHERNADYLLTLTATDRGTPQQKSNSVILRVEVIDQNDNKPVFDEQVYHLQLRENLSRGTRITTVHASDADSSNYGEFRYFVPATGNSEVAKNLIRVDPVNGDVFLKTSLDREKHNNIQVIIGARDLAGEESKVGKTILAIQVTDVNDNAPHIQINIITEANHSTAFLSESCAVGTYVAQVTAKDADFERNGQVKLTISTFLLSEAAKSAENSITLSSDINEYFILQEGGFITTGHRLDREAIPGFRISILACDKAIEPLCSKKNLTVKLLDENDNPPVFSMRRKITRLREDTDPGTLVATAVASDRDSFFQPAFALTKKKRIERSHNGDINYSLSNGGDHFAVDENSGKVKVVNALDYEKKKTWHLLVNAHDLGEKSNSANFSLTVELIDVNDNRPIFLTPAFANQTVPATIRSGDVITKIKAVDYDENGRAEVRYCILSEDGSKEQPSIFVLDQFSGNLRLNMSNPNLKGIEGTHTVLIKAQDTGSPPLEKITSIRVEVYDLPLAALPKFTKMEEEPHMANSNMLVILIASLAGGAILLVSVLAITIIKCRKEKKEIQTYNCRTAATQKGHKFSISRSRLASDGTTTSHHLMNSRDSHLDTLNWSKQLEAKLADDISRTNSLSRASNSGVVIRMSSFSKEPRYHTHHLVTSQIDRDSGRGDSDHDTGSYEEKTMTLMQEDSNAKLHEINLHQTNELIKPDTTEADCLGPRCTHFCRQYGHSDECWMPVEENRNPPYRYDFVEDHRRVVSPLPHHFPETQHHNIYALGGLETICETQPLHTVLGTDSNYEHIQNYHSYGDRNQIAMQNVPHSGYYSDDASLTFSAVPHGYHSRDRSGASTPRQCQQISHAAYGHVYHSVSDVFHDRISAAVSSTAPSVRCHSADFTSTQPSMGSTSRPSHSESGSLRRSTASHPQSASSLHGDHLQHRFMAAAHGNTQRDLARAASLNSSRYGRVSIEETQQIIDGIDQLIDH